ncbi:MAG TPA: helix-turn-helix transcriptional regulator [Kofleriaceae bacterium]|nr:helix-turn-helix transcriptional regulator [Kofleriaceae bacterium]
MDRRNQTIDTTTGPTRPRTAPPISPPSRPRVALASDSGGTQATHAEFAAWLTAGRTARAMSREHVARVTRIQLRTLERLEEGRFDELPADVFVRGFIRNYARCVGLSVDEALSRYGACGFVAAPVASAQAQALLETMVPRSVTSSVTVIRSAPQILKTETDAAPSVVAKPAPTIETKPAVAIETGEAVAAAVVAETSAATATTSRPRPRVTGGGRRERDAKGRFVRKGTLSGQMEAVSPPDDVPAELLASFDAPPAWPRSTQDDLVQLAEQALRADDDLDVEIVIEPTADTGSAPVVAPMTATNALTAPTTAPVVAVAPSSGTMVRVPAPSLVIDDDDPEVAEREREQRAKEREDGGGWRSFLPPALLDQDRGRQGGLTLAVIILLIVATLTLSYLMRRPSSTGEGVTSLPPAPTHLT